MAAPLGVGDLDWACTDFDTWIKLYAIPQTCGRRVGPLGAAVKPKTRVDEHSAWLSACVVWEGDVPVLTLEGVQLMWEFVTRGRISCQEDIVRRLRLRAPLD